MRINTGILIVLALVTLLTLAGTGSAEVPAGVSDIITNNCASCHVDKPTWHTDTAPGGMDSDQCSQCHIPYANTADYDHIATTTGCTLCHNTVNGTHFFMRDNADQTVLVANAENEGATSHGQAHGCIYCHRDNRGNGFTTTELSTGKGYPALMTNADIIAAAEKGTLRSWIQPGGFMAKYLNATEIATITNWIDTEYTNERTLGYNPYLDAVKTADFDINDLVTGTDNPAWNLATEHVISVNPTVYTAADKIKLKALYSDEYLYIRAEWADSTASLTRANSWIMNGSKWRHPEAISDNDKQSEDRIAFFWNINTPDYKARNGCAISCHGNVPGSAKFTNTVGATMDIWHMKAARGLGLYNTSDTGDLTISGNEAYEATAGTVKFSGVLDDKRLVSYMDTDDGYNTEDSGRRADSGTSAYSNNRNATKATPKFIEIAPTSWIDAMVLTQAEVDAGETVVADPTATGYNATAVTNAWNNYVTLDAVVPERILRDVAGSRGDVLNTAVWKDGVWVNEFRRKLVTGNADDAQFDLANNTMYDFSVAVFDNCGRGEIPPGHTTYGDGQYQILRLNAASTSSVPLTTGWNLVALIGTPTVTSTVSVMSSVVDNITVVWGYDKTAEQPWKLYDPAMPSELNSLKNIVPGKGYWIFAKTDVEWTY